MSLGDRDILFGGGVVARFGGRGGWSLWNRGIPSHGGRLGLSDGDNLSLGGRVGASI